MTNDIDMQRPIFVTGIARQGTTFQQWLLSSHPKIHISGQPTAYIEEALDVYKKLAAAGERANALNRRAEYESYRLPHWCGSGYQGTKHHFSVFLANYLRGSDTIFSTQKIRWGAKLIWASSKDTISQPLQELFPDCRWIVCIRHPLTSYLSQINTFSPHENLDGWLVAWLESVRFATSNDHAMIFKVDQLKDCSPSVRLAEANKVFEFLGEAPTVETNSFVDEWPIVHKVTVDRPPVHIFPRDVICAIVGRHPTLVETAGSLGYNIDWRHCYGCN